MENKYLWTNFYMEFADALLQYKDNRAKLIKKIKDVYRSAGENFPVLERDNKITDIDPFTIYGMFNKGLSDEKRVKIVNAIASEFDIKTEVPHRFAGIPVVNNLNPTFYAPKGERGKHDIDNLWEVFDDAIQYAASFSETDKRSLQNSYDLVREQKGVKWNITMGLYWIRPNVFINLDKRNREFVTDTDNMPPCFNAIFESLDNVVPPDGASYLLMCELARNAVKEADCPYHSFPELSYNAWHKTKEKEKGEPAPEIDKPEEGSGHVNPYSHLLSEESPNIIFRGAPGTGKTYLAKQIAADIVSNGACQSVEKLTREQEQIEFVQFHPSYDYTDFVEGLRPHINEDGTMGFKLQDGIFKRFVARARENLESKYVFIIDEINRGEISKIFGELFFAIDPGYRGKDGEVSTQYANMHADPNDKLYIPKNVYIIGTMNDIDRSVDSFDFAMRRRFRFVELKADEQIGMLDELGDKRQEAINRMKALNEAIAATEDLNENYQIGAAYFLKLKNLSFDALWEDYLEPLLHDYVQGMYDEEEIMSKFKNAYENPKASEDTADETGEN